MNKSISKSFDCVQSVRQIRDRLSQEVADLSYEDLSRWFRSYQYSDPVFKEWAENAAQQGAQADPQ